VSFGDLRGICLTGTEIERNQIYNRYQMNDRINGIEYYGCCNFIQGAFICFVPK
jgi:hypothetical protein